MEKEKYIFIQESTYPDGGTCNLKIEKEMQMSGMHGIEAFHEFCKSVGIAIGFSPDTIKEWFDNECE